MPTTRRYGHLRPRLPLSVTEAGRALSRTLTGYAELCLSAQVPSSIATLASAHIVDLVSHANGVLAEGLSDRTKAPVILSIMLDLLVVIVAILGFPPQHLRENSTARSVMYTSRFPAPGVRSANTSTAGELLSAPVLCSTMVKIRRLQKSRSRRASAIFAFQPAFQAQSWYPAPGVSARPGRPLGGRFQIPDASVTMASSWRRQWPSACSRRFRPSGLSSRYWTLHAEPRRCQARAVTRIE